ncbi:MAG: tRNA 2-thiocytidine(32) synthetase TtcA [Acidobacteria bacterium]|nr:tRNA 2-thiocytidine(32) synthetase TtcA [Acidobacteriota bacterium]
MESEVTLVQLVSAKPKSLRSIEALETSILRRVGTAIKEFDMIEQGDRVMVALSGGKDSWTLLHVLRQLQKRAPVDFELLAVNIDQGYPGFRQDIIEDYLKREGYGYHMASNPTYEIMQHKLEPGTTGCSLCSRLRRGTLYRLAQDLGATKIALGHHADDLLVTLLLSIFFRGEIRSMPPRLVSDDKRNVVIRPLCYVYEEEIRQYAAAKGFPVISCASPYCEDETNFRPQMKRLLEQLERQYPRLKNSMLASLGKVTLSHLMDRRYLSLNGSKSNDEREGEPALQQLVPLS